MSTIETERPRSRYALGHSSEEYDRLRTQARVWEDATGRLLDRVVTGVFHAMGADVHTGARLPQLFTQAGIGYPDGTDVAGRIEPFGTGRAFLERVFRSVLPVALAYGITTSAGATELLATIDRDAARFADCPM